MCKEMPVSPVDRVVDKKRIIEKFEGRGGGEAQGVADPKKYVSPSPTRACSIQARPSPSKKCWQAAFKHENISKLQITNQLTRRKAFFGRRERELSILLEDR
jgi:hypothetical protein